MPNHFKLILILNKLGNQIRNKWRRTLTFKQHVQVLTVQISHCCLSVLAEWRGQSRKSEWKAHVLCWSQTLPWSSPKNVQSLYGITKKDKKINRWNKQALNTKAAKNSFEANGYGLWHDYGHLLEYIPWRMMPCW